MAHITPSPYANVSIDTCRFVGGGSITVSQDESIIALPSRDAALRLASEITALADIFWDADPSPVTGHEFPTGYAELSARGE